MRKKPLKRKTGLKRTPIRKVSAKLSKELRLYYVLRDLWFKNPDNVMCQCGKTCGMWGQATQVHHKKRRGKYLNDTSTWMPVCAPCHEWIESHANEARTMGWLLT